VGSPHAEDDIVGGPMARTLPQGYSLVVDKVDIEIVMTPMHLEVPSMHMGMRIRRGTSPHDIYSCKTSGSTVKDVARWHSTA